MNLKGDVIAIKDLHNGKIIFFNEQGFVEKEVGFDDKNNPSSFTTYLYLDNKLNIEKLYGINGNYTNIYYYDQDGKLASSSLTAIINREMTWKIDIDYFMGGNGNIVKELSKDKIILGDTKPTEKTSITQYYYSGNILDSMIIDHSNGNRIVNSFKQNLLINSFEFDSTGNLNKENSKDDFEYKYDAVGNWIQRSYKMGQSNIVETREIFYKGSDISNFIKMYSDIKFKLDPDSRVEEKEVAPKDKIDYSQNDIVIPPPINTQNYETQSSNYFTDIRRNQIIGYVKDGMYIFNTDNRILGKIDDDIIYIAESNAIGRKVGVIKGELIYELNEGSLGKVVAIVKDGYIKQIANGSERGVVGTYVGDEINGYACAAVLLLF
jgi:hypothetical protein